eukprot:431320_1
MSSSYCAGSGTENVTCSGCVPKGASRCCWLTESGHCILKGTGPDQYGTSECIGTWSDCPGYQTINERDVLPIILIVSFITVIICIVLGCTLWGKYNKWKNKSNSSPNDPSHIQTETQTTQQIESHQTYVPNTAISSANNGAKQPQVIYVQQIYAPMQVQANQSGAQVTHC